MNDRIKVPAWLYQQFDADFSREVPAEGFGGWRQQDIEISCGHTALVVMHALDCGARDEYSGWHRAVEYLPRAREIADEVFPGLLQCVRERGLTILHVPSPGPYYRTLPGYQQAARLAGASPAFPPGAESDAVLQQLQQLRRECVSVGLHNEADIARGGQTPDFLPSARPLDSEGIAEDTHQLNALCRASGINHLIYIGFALNWCLLLSPGGMIDMSRHGYLCSTIREAVTAVENRETARGELAKEIGLWRVALAFGFVFGADDFIEALRSS